MALLLSYVAALFDGMIADFSIINAITFAIKNDEALSLFTIMAAVFAGIIRAFIGEISFS